MDRTPLTDYERTEIEESFEFLDLDRDGYITTDEMMTLMRLINLNVDEEQLEDINLQLEKAGQSKMCRKTLLGLLERIKYYLTTKEAVTLDELRVAFDACSPTVINEKGVVAILTKDLVHVLQTFGMGLSANEIGDMMEEADTDKTDYVDFLEFKMMMKDTGIFPGNTFQK